jgi:CBS-domain-containing membrane protein
MKIADVMTKQVRTVESETPLKEVARILAYLGISGLPVVSPEGRVLGIVSEGDLLFKERGATPAHRGGLLGLLLEWDDDEAKAEVKLHARTAGEAMSSPAITIGPTASLTEAASLMLDKHVKRLPVLGEDGALLGIVTRADLVRAFLRPDSEIEREIREDLILRTLWIAPERVNVTVDHGEVSLSGEVESQADAEVLVKFAQRVPGVVTVLSKLKWPADSNGSRRRDHTIAKA